ncbi:DUF6256 family protein [Streptomyces xiamenensis]
MPPHRLLGAVRGPALVRPARVRPGGTSRSAARSGNRTPWRTGSRSAPPRAGYVLLMIYLATFMRIIRADPRAPPRRGRRQVIGTYVGGWLPLMVVIVGYDGDLARHNPSLRTARGHRHARPDGPHAPAPPRRLLDRHPPDSPHHAPRRAPPPGAEP